VADWDTDVAEMFWHHRLDGFENFSVRDRKLGMRENADVRRKLPTNRPRDRTGKLAEYMFSHLREWIDEGRLSEEKARAFILHRVSKQTGSSERAVRVAWRRERERRKARTRN
jgi:hypothetical protein